MSTLLAVVSIAFAAPAWQPAEGAALGKRAWPYGYGDCYGSGQWGKQEDGKHTIRDFCMKHGNGQIPPMGLIGKGQPQPWIEDTFSYSSAVEWKIQVQTSALVSLGPELTYEECIIALYQAINYCWGDNQSTRGGEGFVRKLYVSIDPETKH
ncbi:hypothetical protein C8A03DRAFT_38235 [Achaetomium macrosporum]|uniref:Uncharacterized protein n=1 Tax=Achaetomium macrosporum TaxID=79813 RepID=A0AAN7C2F6_9PEZI|nr:hypothetical protein C8A03DRAFT_38235 [Achaetomium macrosporum]